MSLRVVPVGGWLGVRRFVDVPFRLFDLREDAPWIPPLRMAVHGLLSRRANPFYRRADRALFVAERDGRPVGRVAAVENRWHNEHHGDRTGFFGFFESVDDVEVAGALLERAEGWLTDRGLTTSRGPTSPSMNHECGLLVDGFGEHPVALTPWNPPYYPALLEAAGYGPARDLVAYDMPLDQGLQASRRLARLATRVGSRSGITFRDADFGDFEAEAERAWPVYCEAWRDNWGFVPPDRTEFVHLAQELKPLLLRRFTFMAEVEGEVVGFLFVIGDLNLLLKEMPSGRAWPWNLFRILRGVDRLNRGRVILMGTRDRQRHRGVFPLLAHELLRRGREAGGERAEASWILADNRALRDPLDSLGFAPYRRWRIYEKSLAPPPPPTRTPDPEPDQE